MEFRAILASGWGFDSKYLVSFKSPDFSLWLHKGSARIRDERTEQEETIQSFFGKLEELVRNGYYGVGYFGYEFFRYLTSMQPNGCKDGAMLPEAAFMFFRGTPSPLSDAKPERGGWKARLKPNMSRAEFLRMVRRIKQYIASGDVYQVNISQRFDVENPGDPLQIFLRLYRLQPTRFACLLDFSEFQILSGSMELFLRKEGRRLASRPIKGTRPRAREPEVDRRLREELRESEKERAENLMIVDLMRNDLGRICEFGTVKVTKLFEVEGYTTLYQMFSEIVGEARNGVGLREILEATFPPGSVTGAPKTRAMEIIDELEPHIREPYCGTIVVLRPSGDFDMSVAIRVLVLCGGRGSLWVGGGITWGSSPNAEYEETLVKARALLGALGAE
jgi:aminodeoxychorismate synthase component I